MADTCARQDLCLGVCLLLTAVVLAGVAFYAAGRGNWGDALGVALLSGVVGYCAASTLNASGGLVENLREQAADMRRSADALEETSRRELPR